MSKHIKVEDIIDAIKDLNRKVFLDRKTLLPVIKAIAGLPTIDIVHCKDCGHCLSEEIEETMPIYIYCDLWKGETEWDSYCSYGERTEE